MIGPNVVAQLLEAVEERRAHVLEGGALDRVAEEAPRRLEVVGDVGRDRDAVVAVAHEDLCVNQPVSRAGAASEKRREKRRDI